mgnify:CR=1 FL=1
MIQWFDHSKRESRQDPAFLLKRFQGNFQQFIGLLEKNYQALKILAEMEEKAQGNAHFDLNYVRNSVSLIRSGLAEMIDLLISIGGDKYSPLWNRLRFIESEIETVMPLSQTIEADDYVIEIADIDRVRSGSVGNKMAQLGEIRSRIGLAAPDGFAISAWAYKYFMDANNLGDRIAALLSRLDLKSFSEIERTSSEISNLIISAPLPSDLLEAILAGSARLLNRHPGARLAIRSSAIGEDSFFSFAGQYATFLNAGHEEIVDCYKKVIASKFSPRAIYYCLSHSLSELDMAMAVCCVVTIDARAAGVIYTRDPVSPTANCLLINSINGLGKLLVDGLITPDSFRVSRLDRKIKETKISTKNRYLAVSPKGGIEEYTADHDQADSPSINAEEIDRLADFALQIENHYKCPQDIEWAIDKTGNIYFLQTRPLRLSPHHEETGAPDLSGRSIIVKGGTTICRGIGCGPVFFASSVADLEKMPHGAVLVAVNPFPGLVSVFNNASALVTRLASVASHMATLTREYRIPTLGGIECFDKFKSNETVTVDASNRVVYSGPCPETLKEKQSSRGLFDGSDSVILLRNVLKHISPLNMLHPNDPDFNIDNIKTFHDIIRFVHQKGIEEIFAGAKNLHGREGISVKLKSHIPLQVSIIYIDREITGLPEQPAEVDDRVIGSKPMQALWNGILTIGWPHPIKPAKRFLVDETISTSVAGLENSEYSEKSFAIVGKEYMLLGLRMGYHLTTIEAMCTEIPNKNHIRMQYKDGGASLDRRIRRVRLIEHILRKLGFDNKSRGDFLDSSLDGAEETITLHTLYLLGKVIMMTKQLDMALSNDAVAEWYRDEILEKLGFKTDKD